MSSLLQLLKISPVSLKMFSRTFVYKVTLLSFCVTTFAQAQPPAHFHREDTRSRSNRFQNNPFLNNVNRANVNYADNDDSFVYPSEDEQQNYYSQSLSKSEQKCKEYSKLIYDTVSAIPLLVDPEQVNVSVPKCEYGGNPLIVGGTPALAGEFPYMATVGGYNADNELEWYCGGTLVSEKFVLTAAHCVKSTKGAPTVVRLGDLDLVRNDDDSEPQEYSIADIIVHENYRPPVKYNDIALLKLNTNVQFTKFVRPACLLNKYSLEQNKVIATGWGRTGASEDQSDILQKVGLTVFDNRECDKAFPSTIQLYRRVLPQGITDKMMCAGELAGGKDTCQGDSGGPLVITDRSNQCLFYVVGITSFGKNCGAQNSPAVYTSVSQFVSWIERHVW